MDKIIRIILFIILYGVLLNRYVSGGELECGKCHQKVYDEITRAVFKHSEFVQRDCTGCHISGKSSLSGLNSYETTKTRRVNLTNYSEEHLVILSNISNDSIYQFKIKINDRNDKKNESELLTFIPASISEFMVDDKTPPQSSNVKVNRIDISVFASGEIFWETDELSDSRVEYGQTEDYKYSSYSDIYTKRHSIKLNNLDHKKKYHFRVVSSDSFGNKIFSDDYTFDTSKSFNNGRTTDIKKDEDSKPDFRVVKIIRLKPKEKELNKEKEASKCSVAIYFTTTSEVASVVEYVENKAGSDTKGFASVEEIHGRGMLKNRKEAGIDACVEKCHKQGASHPVGVSPKGNIRIPDTLPTSDGKVITCATCHLPHGSKERYLARMDFKRDMCVLCHLDRL